VNFADVDMGRPLVTPRLLANVLQTFGGVVLFVFLQPWYESTYYGLGDRRVTTARLGLPASPWLTYRSDRAGGRDIGPGLQVAAKSKSWPLLPAGIGLMWLGVRIARRSDRANKATDAQAEPGAAPDTGRM
jgi:hypothetical protein